MRSLRTHSLLLLFVLFSFSAAAKENIDSLTRYVAGCKEDTAKMEGLIRLCKALVPSYPDSVIRVNKSLLNLSLQLHNDRGEGISYENLGNYHNGRANYKEALSWLLKAGVCYQRGHLQKELGVLYNSIGNTYLGINNDSKALEYFELSRDIAEQINHEYNKAIANVGISSVMSRKQNFRGALKALYSARLSFEKTNSAYPLGVVLANIGETYARMHKTDSALYYFDRSMVINEQVGNNYAIYSTLLLKGNLLAENDHTDQAMSLYNKALVMAHADNSASVESEVYKALSLGYKQLHNYPAALENYIHYSELKDTVFNSENNKQLLEMQTKYETEKKDNQIKILHQQQEIQLNNLNKQRMILILAVVGFLIILSVSFLQYRNSIRRKRMTEILQHQKNIIQEKNQNITDSIHYAKKIQEVIMPHALELNALRKEHFILNLPKDIVSGDFYWTHIKENCTYIAVCDSTGHGVPGAFMSLLNIGFLNEAINDKRLEKPNEILDFCRTRLVENVGKEGQQDGFDGILLCIHNNGKSMSYAAANNNGVLVRNGKFQLLEKDRMPVGLGEKKDPFRLFELELETNDQLYLFTDGYADQFGGTQGKKFKYNNLYSFLENNSHLPPEAQKKLLMHNFEEWKGPLEQVDDVCIIGIKI